MAEKQLTKASIPIETVALPSSERRGDASKTVKTNLPANRAKTGKKLFQKGQSGNPSGRPKTAFFSEEVRKFLKEGSGDKTRLREVLLSLKEHDPKILLYYAFGKPVETVELSGRDGGAIQLTHVPSDAELMAIASSN